MDNLWTIRIFFDGDAADPAVYPLKSCSIPRCVGAAGTHAQQKATVSISGPTVSLSLKLVGRKEQTKAEIYEGTAIRFTGLIDTDWDFDAKGRLIESVSLTVMDYSGKLKIGVFGKDVAPENARLVRGPQRWQNYAVCDPASQDTSIVHQILKLAAGFLGITIPVKCDATCTTRLDYFQLEQDSDLKTQLEQLLKEFRLDYIFDADNSIRIISTDSTGEPVATVTDFRNSLRGSGSVYKPKSIKATWRKYERRVGEKIGEGYHKSDSVNSRSVEYGQDVTWSLPDGANLDDWEIVSIENLNPGSTWTETGVTHPRIDGASAKITSYDLEGCHIVMERHGACAKGYIRARITADIVIRYNKTQELYSNPGTTQESLTLLHHHQLSSSDGIEGATEYAMYYEAMKRKASTTYTFSSLSEYAPGAIVTLSESSVTGISAKVRILEQTLDPLTGIYKYKAEGAGDLDLKEAITKAETSEDHPIYGGDFLELSADLDESTGVVTVVAEGDAIDYYGLTPAWDLNGTSVTSTGLSVTFPVRDLALSGNVVTCTATLNGETVTATYDIDQLLSAPTLAIFTGDGSLFPAGLVNATLSAVLMRSGVDVALANVSVFRWTRTSSDTVADATWNASAKATGKRSIIITDSDLVDGKAVFTVSCTIGTNTYTSAGFSVVTVSDGQNGWSQATLQLFKRSATAPAKYDGSALTYTFSTATLAGNHGSWSVTIPSGSNPLYVIYAPAFGQGETDVVEVSDWTVPAILSENGTRGENGDTVATVMLYQRSASTPYKPTGVVTYNFLSGAVSNTGSWSNTVPASNGNPLWVITAVASVTGSSNVHEDTIQPSEWSTPSIMAKDGEQGPQGEQGIQGIQGIQGPQGEQGIPGKDGTDGRTTYFHIKYAPVQAPTASQMTETPSDYIGTYVDYTEGDSSDPSKYTWSRFKGAQGDKGDQGLPGTNGENGKTSYLHIAYANSADGSTGFTTNDADSAGKLYIGQYTDFVQADSSSPASYHWTKIKGETGATGPQGEKGEAGATGATGNGIKSVTVTYGVSSSASTQPTSWQNTVPAVSEGQYLWTRTITDYTDDSVADTVTYTYAKQGKTGGTGATGATGNGIRSVTNHYLATNASNGVTTSTSGWSTTVQTMTETNKYLWNYETIAYTNGTSVNSTPCIIGVYGSKGNPGSPGTSVTVSSIQYQAGTSATTAPTGTWSNNPVSAQGRYLWTKTTFSDGKVAYGVARQGTDGNPGATGATGRGISSIAHYYATTTTQSAPSASSITSTTIPAMSASKKYLWRKTVITYTDSTTSPSVELIAIYGDIGDSASIKDFDIDLSAKSFSVSPRGYTRTAETIVATCTLIHVAVSAVTITWSSTSSQVTLTPSSDKTTCTISVAARVALLPFRISCAVTGVGLTKTVSVDVQPETGNAYMPIYLGTNWDTSKSWSNSNDPIWSGDYYLDTSTNTPMIASVSGSGTITYSAMQTGNPNTALIMGNVLSDILAQGSGVQSTCVAVNAYFGAIAAKTGFIKSLRSQVIQSMNYEEDASGQPTAGYKLDGPNNVIKSANMQAVGGIFRDVSIVGGSTQIANKKGETVFKTVADSIAVNQIDYVVPNNNKYYLVSSVIDAMAIKPNTSIKYAKAANAEAIANGIGYDGAIYTTPGEIGFHTFLEVDAQTGIVERNDLDNSLLTIQKAPDGYYGIRRFTIPYYGITSISADFGRGGQRWDGLTPTIKLYAPNGSLLYSGAGNETVLKNIGLQYPDGIPVGSTVEAWLGNEYAYYRFFVFRSQLPSVESKGLVFYNTKATNANAFALVIPEFSNIPFRFTKVDDKPSVISSNDFTTAVPASSIWNAFGGTGVFVAAPDSGSVYSDRKHGLKSVFSVNVTTNSMTIILSDGSVMQYPRTGYVDNPCLHLLVAGEREGILVSNITPVHEGVDIGYPSKPFSHAYVGDVDLSRNLFRGMILWHLCQKDPEGTVIPPTGFLLLDNSFSISRSGSYAALFALIEQVGIVGNGKVFQYGTDNNTIIAPDVEGRYLRISNNGDSGILLAAGLPDIVGSLRFFGHGDGLVESATGAFAKTGYYESESGYKHANTGGHRTVEMEASRSNVIYGRSTSVTPSTIPLHLIIGY